jgi:hypothetical protein
LNKGLLAKTIVLVGLGIIIISLFSVTIPVPVAKASSTQNNLIAEMLSKVDTAEIYSTIYALQSFTTRCYGYSGNTQTAAYLYGRFSNIPGLAVEYQSSYNNVIATLSGVDSTSKEIYVFGAHYDSKNYENESFAPGATDNGGGVAIVLELARIMSQYRFNNTLKFALWNDEEWGMLGSTAYVQDAYGKNTNVSVYVNFDGCCYNSRQMATVVMYNQKSNWVSNMMAEYNTLYGIGLTLSYNTHNDYSDHIPFWNYGYTAVMVHEGTHGPYHTPDDTIDKVSTVFAMKNGQLGMSVLAALAKVGSPAPTPTPSPPVTSDDYNGLWHNSDFTITLTATDDIGVDVTFYRINNGATESVVANGQPLIATEGAANTLEYWSVDNSGNTEQPHKMLTQVKLDKTVPVAEAGLNQTVAVGTAFAFNGSGSTDNIGIASYIWDFGDGTTGMGTSPTHKYANTGTYVTTLTVVDLAGNRDASSSTVTVKVTVPEFPSGLLIVLIVVSLSASTLFFRKKLKIQD